jgi:hypothetical protein
VPGIKLLLGLAALGLLPALAAKYNGRADTPLAFIGWWLFGTVLFCVALPWALDAKPDPAERVEAAD